LFCILTQLEQRERTGLGAFIDLAMQDVGVWATQTGWLPEQRTAHTVLRCRDGDVAAIGDTATVETALASIVPANADRSTVAEHLMSRGIPAAPVRTIDEVGISEQQPGGFIRLVDTGKNRWPLLELPFRLSRMPHYELKTIGALGKANADFPAAAKTSA
jgi:crotonobetainyl-CoA:carnitine CoA-transferase CaiB-like acyl-CoA transferase